MKNADMPAMPIELSGFNQFAPEAHIGLTKREMFAMSAMQGILSNSALKMDINRIEIANFAIGYADALLTELEK